MISLNLQYLTFSDGAKYADIARNIASGLGKVSSFNFWGTDNSMWIQPFTPYSMAIAFKLFGINDFTVIATTIFYFLVSLVFVYLLTNRLYKSKLTSILATTTVGFNYNLINYATSGASESPFIFELLGATYFLTIKKWWGNLLGLVFMILMYFTRPQAIIYIYGLLFFYFVSNFSWRKGTIYTFVTFLIGTIFYLLFSRQGLFAVTQNLPGVAVSDSLRGGNFDFNLTILIKKLFYNLYNFYKYLPDIINPYLFALFLIGVVRKLTKFNVFVTFVVVLTFLITAITIPFYRYTHVIIPFVYIVAIGTLNVLIKNKKILIVLVMFFSVGQTLGIILLDSRFENKTKNINKPPIYVNMSYKLKEITNSNQTVLTNLDTWGSWYGERNTTWFPLDPSMVATYKDNIDAIYLTSYKIDDENYHMGENWRKIFYNPENQTLLPDYEFVAGYQFNSDDNYEKEDGRAILLVKKE